jgi:hypothetical protein
MELAINFDHRMEYSAAESFVCRWVSVKFARRLRYESVRDILHLFLKPSNPWGRTTQKPSANLSLGLSQQ